MKLYFVGNYKFDSEFKHFTSVFSTTWVSFRFMNVEFLPLNGFFLCVLQIKYNLETSIGFHC